MTYRVNLPEALIRRRFCQAAAAGGRRTPAASALGKRTDPRANDGRVQQEVFRSLVQQRFALDVTLSDQRIFYKETIENTVEGVGILSRCATMPRCICCWSRCRRQRSGIRHRMSHGRAGCQLPAAHPDHLEEKVHRGVLVGGPITDMKITLLVVRRT